jgi:hypothetical protein
MKSPHNYGLLACDVFEEEIAALKSDNLPWREIEYLEMGLHDQPDTLRATVQSVIDRWDCISGIDTIVLAYGLCGNGLVGVEARSKPLVLPRAHDCISILLGSPNAHDAVLKENPATYFYSPGWIKGRRVPGPDRDAAMREQYAERYPDDPDMVDDLIEADQSTFAHHNCAAYVDVTANESAENYCRDCARHLGWEFRKLRGDPHLLRALLDGDWDNPAFLTVPPRHRIERENTDNIVRAQAPDGAA